MRRFSAKPSALHQRHHSIHSITRKERSMRKFSTSIALALTTLLFASISSSPTNIRAVGQGQWHVRERIEHRRELRQQCKCRNECHFD